MSRLLLPGKFKFQLLTGIRSRRICAPHEDSLSLALSAVKICFKHSNLQAQQIDLVINCSITRYKDGYHQLYEPSLSYHIAKEIGAKEAQYFDVSNACAGMLTGIQIADRLIRDGSIKSCLIVSGEFISSLIDHAIRNIKTPASNELASLTVGDGGAAVILEATQNKDEAIQLAGFSTLSQYNDLCMAQPHRKHPGAFMKTKAKRIHEVSIQQSIPIVEQALLEWQLKYSDIDWLIPHQTSRSAIISGMRSFQKHFKTQPGQVIINLSDNGNTASTTHFLTLFQYLNKGAFKPNDRLMLLSFASGIVIGMLLFKPHQLINQYGD